MKDLDKQALAYHEKHHGKLYIGTHESIESRKDMTLAYTPGVAEVSRAIVKDPATAGTYTFKNRMIAIVTDGSAVLGLGNIGSLAALPVMEGKSALLKRFAGLEAFPICLSHQDEASIIRTVEDIAGMFGAIMLEDIAAPKCVAIEEHLQESLPIPVFHDDQHGTAIVVLAALINALEHTGKTFRDIHVVLSGTGAAGHAVASLLATFGVSDIRAMNIDGPVNRDTDDPLCQRLFAAQVLRPAASADRAELFDGADVFIGVSAPNIVDPAMIRRMNDRPIVFAMANPDPEITKKDALAGGARVYGSGRSDDVNQINNCLVFPGLMAGLMRSDAKRVTPAMKHAAAIALAQCVDETEIAKGQILPSVFDDKVPDAIAEAVIRTASGSTP